VPECVVSRMHDDREGEATNVFHPPVIIAGLPILQAPTDDNDTHTTVINRFVNISNYTSQKHTVTTGDQPLHSSGKNCYGQRPKCEDVISWEDCTFAFTS